MMNNPASMEESGTGVGRKKIPTPKEEAARKVYANEDGTLYVPSIAFRSALLTAAKGRRIGKQAATSVLPGAVFNVDTRTPLVHPDTGEAIKDYDVNVVRAVVQKNGVRRARPEIPRWGCRLYLEIDTEPIDARLVADLLMIAGKVAGVGDWRPEKKGAHGRFRAEMVGEMNLD